MSVGTKLINGIKDIIGNKAEISAVCTGFQYGMYFALEHPEVAQGLHDDIILEQIDRMPDINKKYGTSYDFVAEQIEIHFIKMNHSIMEALDA